MFARYRRLLRFVQPYWPRLAFAGVILIISSLASLALPLVVRNVIDSALLQSNLLLLNAVTVLLLVLFALQAVLGFGQSYLLGWTGERVRRQSAQGAIRTPALHAAALLCEHPDRRAPVTARQ